MIGLVAWGVLCLASRAEAAGEPSPAPVSLGASAWENGSVELDHGWRFLEDVSPSAPPAPSDPRWRGIQSTFFEPGERPTGPAGPTAGGWFELRLELVDIEPLDVPALRLRHPGASEIWLDDRLVRRFGTVAREPADERPFDPRGTPVALPFDGPGVHRLAIRYSCADAARPRLGPWLLQRGGAGFSARLDSMDHAVEDAFERRAQSQTLDIGIMGVALGFAFLHGAIFFFHRRHLGNLWFALFALSLAVNGAGNTLLDGWSRSGLLGLAVLRAVNLTSAGLVFLSLLLFLSQLRSKPSYGAVRALAAGFVLVLASSFMPLLGWAFVPIYLGWMLTCVVVTWRAGATVWREQSEQAVYLRVSAVGLIGLIATEASKHFGLPVTGQLVGFGGSTFLILAGASLLLAHRVAGEGRELEVLAQDLEGRVRERTEALERSERQAQAASLAKSAFLATMSHEIRTPMNAVVGLAEMLGRAEIPPREQKMASTLQRNAVSLLRLIDEILDLSQIESGRLTLKVAPLHVDRVLDDVRELFAARAEQQGLALRTSLDPEAPPRILGDRDRLYQIAVNLVGNALKFTERGEIVLSATLSPLSPNRRRLRLEVIDTGMGISEEARERLFDPFFQVDGSSTRRFGGAGLGLAICKRLADLMDAELSVQSTIGRGSRFTLELDVECAEEEAHEKDPADRDAVPAEDPSAGDPAPSRELPRLRILLAEDNEVNQWVIRLLLEELGQEARMVDEGPAVLEALAQEHFDVLILDLHMPGMDGFEVARRIRAETPGRGPYIIAFTASVMEEDRHRCREVGMDDFLSKPADLDRLRAALLRAVRSP